MNIKGFCVRTEYIGEKMFKDKSISMYDLVSIYWWCSWGTSGLLGKRTSISVCAYAGCQDSIYDNILICVSV